MAEWDLSWRKFVKSSGYLAFANSPNEFLGTVGAAKGFKPWLLLTHQLDPCQGTEPKETIPSVHWRRLHRTCKVSAAEIKEGTEGVHSDIFLQLDQCSILGIATKPANARIYQKPQTPDSKKRDANKDLLRQWEYFHRRS